MPQHQQPVDGFIFSILNGNVPSWPDAVDTTFADDLHQELHLHGLYPLIYHLCKDTPAWKTWPPATRERCRKTAIHHAAHELATAPKIRHLLTRLQESGVRPIVLKGTAIAYTHYSENSIRTRGDIDLLLPRSDLPHAFSIMEAAGYKFVFRQGFLGQELGFVDTSPEPKSLPLDIHWRGSSYVLLAHVLDIDDIIDSAIEIPQLAPLPCAMSPVYALLHACVHWAKHTASGDSIRILWMYDIHLLAKGLNKSEIAHFTDGVTQKRISQICQAALASVERKLPCENLGLLLENLDRAQQPEPSARMLERNASSFVPGDILALGSSAALLKSLQDIFMPPGAFILRFYGKQTPLWLPFLYAHRLLAGMVEYARRRTQC